MTVEGEPGAEPAGRAFVIARVFDATREAVWKAWTEAERLECWWGPDGFAAKRCAMDLRPGGSFHYGLRMPGGGVVWGRWAIREVAARERAWTPSRPSPTSRAAWPGTCGRRTGRWKRFQP